MKLSKSTRKGSLTGPKKADSLPSVSKASSPLIPLAKLVRPHGIPKNGVLTLKADLFSPGGEVFRDATRVFVSAPDGAAFAEIKLAAPSAPHGGKWGQASSVLLRFVESEAPDLRSIVALPRTVFPALKDKEFYICDVLGFEVVDEQGRGFGVVTSFHDIAPNSGGVVNLGVKLGSGRHFEFPAAWVNEVQMEARRLVVPEIAAWSELDTKEKPDDA